MKKLYSYIVRYDSGFAPNPFHGYCTLAACRPDVRRVAQVGDWIIGTGSKSRSRDGSLVYAMCITEIISFDEYWKDRRFRKKRPKKNRGKKRLRGDNIYHYDKRTKLWKQEPSFHSCPDGSEDSDKLHHDTKVNRVLISDDFIYLGGDGPPIPDFCEMSLCATWQEYRCKFPEKVVNEFIRWIQSFDEKGYCSKPLDY